MLLMEFLGVCGGGLSRERLMSANCIEICTMNKKICKKEKKKNKAKTKETIHLQDFPKLFQRTSHFTEKIAFVIGHVRVIVFMTFYCDKNVLSDDLQLVEFVEGFCCFSHSLFLCIVSLFV